MYYKGIFKELLEDEFLNIKEVNFYSGEYAHFYEAFLKTTNYDMQVYEKQASMFGGEILELACGNGRIGLPLATQGYHVTGIDLSKDMLKIYEDKLAEERASVRKRVHLINGDITSFHLEEKFDLIIFPATTICLFTNDQIVQIFNCVKEHLAEGGRFILDYAEVSEDNFYKGNGLQFSFPWQYQGSYNIAIAQEFLYCSQQEVVVNIYNERIEGEKVSRLIGYTRKRIITPQIIEQAIETCNLKIHRHFIINDRDGYGSNIGFYLLGKEAF